MVGGGRGGRGNIVNKDQVAPPPAPMEPCLEVETARDRLTTHGRGGEGNLFWHVLEEGVFTTVVHHEQVVALHKRAMDDESPKSPKSSPIDDGDRLGSPTSDRFSLWHTESTCEDGPTTGERLRRFSLGDPLSRALRSSTRRRKRHSASSSSDHGTLEDGTRSRSTTVNSADSHTTPVTPIDGLTPVTPIDGLASSESVASYEEAISVLSGPLEDAASMDDIHAKVCQVHVTESPRSTPTSADTHLPSAFLPPGLRA